MSESAHLFPGMNSQLYRAAEKGDVDTLKNFIEGEDKLNIFQEFTGQGNSVLHIAISRGNLQFIERLLEEVKRNLVAGRDFVMVKNSHGNSALHFAAFSEHHELVGKLVEVMEGDVEAGNFLRSVNNKGNSALHEAAKWGNDKAVEVVLKHDAGLISLPNNAGETALFIASQSGHTKIVERLMDSDSNRKHGVSNRGSGHREIVDELLPLMDSEHYDQTPLYAAVLYGHAGVVKKILQHSPHLAKQTDGCGRTALHMLVLSFPVSGFWGFDWRRVGDFIEVAKLLLEKDNSLCYIEDRNKQTPLHMAAEGLKYFLVEILLENGRDCIEAVDNDGRKPLHVAVINAIRLSETCIDIGEIDKFRKMLVSLISRESLNHRDNTGRTPLHIAMENTKKDALLYYSIIEGLQTNGALPTPEILEDIRKMELSPAHIWIKAENTTINAVLIATVSFAAGFTLPGGLVSQPGEKPEAVFINTLLFNLFLICDTFSFCTSIASAILLQYACVGDREDLSLVAYGVNLLWAALMSLVVAFGAAVHMVITSSPWLVGIVWTMVFFVPLIIHVARSRSKVFLFMPERYKIWLVLWIPLGAMRMIFSTVLDVIRVFLFYGLFYNAAHWIKKLLKWQRQRTALIGIN